MEICLDSTAKKFIDGLEKPVRTRVIRAIDLLETFGNKLEMPHSKRINNRLFELRISGSVKVRIFYEFKNKKVYLVHGFIKKSQKTPQKEIDTAMKRVFN